VKKLRTLRVDTKECELNEIENTADLLPTTSEAKKRSFTTEAAYVITTLLLWRDLLLIGGIRRVLLSLLYLPDGDFFV
jgi:hypothetical protein